MDILQQLSSNIVRMRKEKGLSQEELASEAGLHRTYVSGIERCVRNPTVLILQKLASALGTTPDALLATPENR